MRYQYIACLSFDYQSPVDCIWMIESLSGTEMSTVSSLFVSLPPLIFSFSFFLTMTLKSFSLYLTESKPRVKPHDPNCGIVWVLIASPDLILKWKAGVHVKQKRARGMCDPEQCGVSLPVIWCGDNMTEHIDMRGCVELFAPCHGCYTERGPRRGQPRHRG